MQVNTCFFLMQLSQTVILAEANIVMRKTQHDGSLFDLLKIIKCIASPFLKWEYMQDALVVQPFFFESVEMNTTNIFVFIFKHHKLVTLDGTCETTPTLVSNIQLEKVYWYMCPAFSCINCFWKIHISTQDILQKCQQLSQRYEKEERTSSLLAT